MRDHKRDDSLAPDGPLDAARPAVGRSTITQRHFARTDPVQRAILDSAWATDPVQRAADAHTGLDDDGVRAAAGHGIAGPGQALPYLDTIQRSFGDHDVSGIRAHFGEQSQAANAALGAHAYATGNDVAFANDSPSLHLVAHEAAHVVQQRAGVSLSSAVGQEGDSYEQHADAVADRVVRGESAADLFAAGPGGGDVAVQRSPKNVEWGSSWVGATDDDSTIDVHGEWMIAGDDGAIVGKNNLGGGKFEDSFDVVKTLPNGNKGTLGVIATSEYELDHAFGNEVGSFKHLYTSKFSIDSDGNVEVDPFTITVMKAPPLKGVGLAIGRASAGAHMVVDHTLISPQVTDGAITFGAQGGDDEAQVGVGGQTSTRTSPSQIMPYTFKLGVAPATKKEKEVPPPQIIDQSTHITNQPGVVAVPEVPHDIEETWVKFKVGTAEPMDNDGMLELFIQQYEAYSKDKAIDMESQILNHNWHIKVIGHASTTGTPANNKKIADARALYVTQELTAGLGLQGLAPGPSETSPITKGERGDKTAMGATGDEVEAEEWRVAKIYVKKIKKAEPGLTPEGK